MKALLLIASFVLSASLSHAGPTVSGGVPPHPALTTMSIEKPQAGIDYPTETVPSFHAVLALYQNKRLPLFNEVPELVPAEAGIDYPTDAPAPLWTEFQQVLAFKNNNIRLPVRLSLQNGTLLWLLKTQPAVDVSKIVAIASYQDRVEMNLVDGTVVEVK